MSTPRSESIAQARSGEFHSAPLPNTESPEAMKIAHYAALAGVLRESFETYVANDEMRDTLNNSRSVSELRQSFTDALTMHTSATLESPAFSAVHAGLRESQLERGRANPNLTTRLEYILDDGARTFVTSAENLYDALEKGVSETVARMPGNASVLDHLAKLNILQFNTYALHYLYEKDHHRYFLSQLAITDNGVRFKPGFPNAAMVPRVLAQGLGLYTNSDLAYDTPDKLRVDEVISPQATIGCPITFYNGQIDELWQMYTTARTSIVQRTELGSSALSFGGSAESR